MSLVTTHEARTTVKPEVNLNETTAAALRRELNSLVAGGCRDVVMDLAQVRMIDAVGLSVLCAAHTTLKREQGNFSIINASGDIETLLRRIGLTRHVTPTPAE